MNLQFSREQLTHDLSAGITVALVGLPQCLAYALMSGLPPSYGLSTAAVAGFVAALLGRSAQVVTGPTNTTGLLILSALLPFLDATGVLRSDAIRVLATLTLLAGAIRVIAAFAGGAHLIRLIPESVLIGFTAGAAILIGIMQLDEALGLRSARATGFLSQMGTVVPFMGHFQWPAVVTAAGTAAVVGMGRRWAPRAPLALFAVLLATATAWLLKLDHADGLPLVRDRHAVTSGWPAIALPDMSPGLLQSLFVPSLAIVLLGTLELAVTARAGGERPDMRREIMAQGWANLAGAFTAAFPASASLGRSALLRLGSAHTRLAPILAAVLTGVLLMIGGTAAGWIPQASLAGVLLVVAARMIDWRGIRRLWDASHETRILLIETVAATLLLPLQWAILLGTGTALVIHVAKTAAPRLRVRRPEGGGLVPLRSGDHAEIVVIEVSGNLHYAAVAPFEEEVEQIVPPSARVIIIDLAHAHEIRFAALRALERLAEEAVHDGAQLWLAGVDEDTARLLVRSRSTLPWMPDDPVPGVSVARCLERIERTRGQ